MILKEGIRYDPYEFSEENISGLNFENESLENMFVRDYKALVQYHGTAYIVGELCLFLKDGFKPICIVDNYTPGLKTNSDYSYYNNTLLIDKKFYFDIDISNIMRKLEKYNYKFTIVNDLKRYIFRDFTLPEFNTIESMEIWLNKTKNKWLRNERKKIKKEKAMV